MKLKHIIITCVLVAAAFGVGHLIQEKPADGGRAKKPRTTVAEVPEEEVPPPVFEPEPVPEEEEPAKPVEEAEPARKGPVTDEEIKKGIGAFGDKLQLVILGRKEGAEAAQELRALLARATPEQVRKIIDQFDDDATPMGERVLLAHVLGQSGHAEAIATLKSTVIDPAAGMMVHRFASHGLAFSDAKGLEPFLAKVARDHDDIGVRANLAFGLQRRGVDEGVGLYFAATDEAFESNDPAALQYLSGFMLMDERALPGIRERLLTYENPQAVLVMIAIVQRKKDHGAVEMLEKLAYDSSRPVSVQKAAEGALKALAKDKP